MIMKHLILLALALLVGCAGPRLGTTYEIQLDPSLSTSQVEAIMLAGDDWKANAPEFTFTYTMTSCRDFSSNLLQTICFRSSDETPSEGGFDVDGHTNFSSNDDRADVMLYPRNMAKRPFQNKELYVVAHEFGHALAHRGDHLQKGNLMAPEIAAQESITTQDVTYVRSTR